MREPRLYKTNAEKQAAYRRRREQDQRLQLAQKGLPALPAPSSLPGTARWNMALRQAAQLLSTVAQEMEAYYEQRSETWQQSDRAAAFQDHLSAVVEAGEAINDLIHE